MIISSQKAGNLVSTHDVIKAVPELLGIVEEYATAARLWASKRNCKTCKRAEIFAPVEVNAIKALLGLAPDAVERLKVYLKEKELYVYEPVPGKPAKTTQLVGTT